MFSRSPPGKCFKCYNYELTPSVKFYKKLPKGDWICVTCVTSVCGMFVEHLEFQFENNNGFTIPPLLLKAYNPR